MFDDEHQRSRMLKKIHSAARRRAEAKRIDFNLPPDHLEDLWRGQEGRCAVSGISFDSTRFDHAFVKHPYAPSLDRRDSRLGYTPRNARLVCTCVNFGLGQWGDEVLRRVAVGMLKKEAAPPAPTEDEEWLRQQRAKLAAAESLAQGLFGEELNAQRRRLAALKRSITLGPEGPRKAAERAHFSRRAVNS
jgi:hypothetical protein